MLKLSDGYGNITIEEEEFYSVAFSSVAFIPQLLVQLIAARERSLLRAIVYALASAYKLPALQSVEAKATCTVG